MGTKTQPYYNYQDEEDFYSNDDQNYEDSTTYDDILDNIIAILQNHGCNHHIDDIEDFLTDHGSLTLAEWSRDLMDPSMTTFTCDYIEQLINQKYPTQIEKPLPITEN